MSEPVCILFVGDVVGGIGKRTLLTLLPDAARPASRPISSSSTARTPPAAWASRRRSPGEMLAAGVDVITLGNHTYRHREIYPYLDEEERILRPANFLASQPGHGSAWSSATASAWAWSPRRATCS